MIKRIHVCKKLSLSAKLYEREWLKTKQAHRIFTVIILSPVSLSVLRSLPYTHTASILLSFLISPPSFLLFLTPALLLPLLHSLAFSSTLALWLFLSLSLSLSIFLSQFLSTPILSPFYHFTLFVTHLLDVTIFFWTEWSSAERYRQGSVWLCRYECRYKGAVVSMQVWVCRCECAGVSGESLWA